MAYIGNTLRTAQPNYQIIDDISGSFNGVTTTFALQVGGVTPAPFPVSAQHCIISVGGVVQEPDPTGTNGFLLSGSNIVFSSAPSSGESFFGTVLAGADYINVGASFPDGSVANPSITFDQDLDTGLYRSASGTTSISANGTNVADFGPSVVTFDTGGSESVRIDSSGRLLVGTSSWSSAATLVLQGNSLASNEDAVIRMARGGTPGANSDLGLITFGDNSGNVGASIRATNDTASSWGSGDYPGRLTFSTTADGASSPTERMTIGQNGEFNHFTSNAFNVRTALTSGAAAVLYVRSNASSTSSGTTVFVVAADGDVSNTNNSYGALSDIKLKENIVDANSQWDDLKALQVRNYNLKEGQTHTQIGLIAQEVELVSPGLVSESPDRDEEGNDLGTVTKSVNYSVLYMKAVKALQEAMSRIEALEAEVTALKGGAS